MTVSREIINDVLNTILKLRNENSPNSYISIKNTLKLFSIPVPAISIPKGKSLYRIRLHTKEESNSLFERISDFGHRVDLNSIRNFGRANEPFQSIFYCSDSPKTAFCETSKLVRNNENDKMEVSSLSIWKTTKDLNVAYLPKDGDYFGNDNVEFLNRNINESFTAFNHEESNNLKHFINTIANEFATDSSEKDFNYLLTCAFANYIYETPMSSMTMKKIGIDGIAYPSVQLRTEGVNFALKPELVTNKDIILQKVISRKMELVSENTYAEIATVVSKMIDYDSDLWRVVW